MGQFFDFRVTAVVKTDIMEQKKATSFYIDYATTEKAEMPKMAMPAKIIEKMQARLTKTKTAVMERREKLKANPPKPMYSVREPQKLRKRKSGADIHHETKRSRSSVDFEKRRKSKSRQPRI